MPSLRVRRIALGIALLALLAIGLRTAWLGDDCYITLRTVENWVRGNGLRWNAGDRVQTYTHPLWMLLLAVGRWLTGECYFTTIAISLALSLGAAALLLWRAATPGALAVVALLLAGTRAFTDYLTSGLETPLTFVLLALFVDACERGRDAPPPFARLVLLAALLATNRMDLALLVAPAVLAAVPGAPFGRRVLTGALAALPFVGWLAFASIYYGSPFPVTAHAKAFGVGIPAAAMWQQGMHYVVFAASDDPLLLLGIAAGVAVGFAQRGTRALAFGSLLYVAYVVKVGGDFMAGRFLLPPFVVATALLARRFAAVPPRWLLAPLGAVLVAIAVRGAPMWLRAPGTEPVPGEAELAAQHGIGDERRIYYPQLGLFAPSRQIPVFGALDAMVRPGGGGPWWLLNGAVGSAGFGAGDRGHVLDPLLCDPLLTRLPARDPQHWRIGHVLRRIPEGYWETLASGENKLRHPGLRAYYDALRALTQRPLLGRERLDAAWRLASGELDAGFRAFVAEDYKKPPRVTIAGADLPPPLPMARYWFDEPRTVLVYDGGLAVQWGTVAPARSLRIQTMGFVDFRVRFVRGGQPIADVLLPQPPASGAALAAVAGLREQVLEVPKAAAGFDSLWLDAVDNAMTHTAVGPPGIGAITLLP